MLPSNRSYLPPPYRRTRGACVRHRFGRAIGGNRPNLLASGSSKTCQCGSPFPFMSTFRSITRIPLFPGDRFPNHNHLAEVTTPLLVIHGKKDQVIPFSQGEDLFRRSPSRQKTFLPVEHARHNDLFESGAFNLPTLILELLGRDDIKTSG